MNYSLNNKVVVITGGSSGIGFSLAKIFAASNAKLYLLARDQNKLKYAASNLRDTYGNDLFVKTFTVDIGIDKEELSKVINHIGTENDGIDILVNNAGILRCGRFDELSIMDFEESFQSNYMGALYTTKAAWKFLALKKGNVSFVSSVAGYIGLIGYSTYSPTKFAMTALAECLRMEGKREGITITIIYPGDTQTPLLEYEQKHALAETLAINKGIAVKEPDEVADKLIAGILSGKFEVYCDNSSKFYRKLKGIFPKIFYRSIDSIAAKASK
ncbi:SDR family NAD(P)-dependent oxidoreductase [Aquiflexum sp.]|uniref:SDR family NAD(P)-dependent oxidoreductase n=1 Tax=Aquiflexum sp. TaxID=1872584 RepID=UPI0035934DBF